MINLAFTSATLAVAIQTRKTEKRNEAMGILGSSSTVTIIFAPLTLVHVIVAIWVSGAETSFLHFSSFPVPLSYLISR